MNTEGTVLRHFSRQGQFSNNWLNKTGERITSAYIVFTRTKTIDQKELETYWAGIRATIKGHPIELLVAYGKHEVLEGDPMEGIVIAKFPDVKAAKDWYYSEAYQSVAQHRKQGAIYNGLIVEGVS